MKIERTKSLKIKVDGEEADNLVSAIKKLNAEMNEIGFKSSSLNEEEKKAFKDLNEKLK